MRSDTWDPTDPVATLLDRIDLDVLSREMNAVCSDAYGGLDEDVVAGPQLRSTRTAMITVLRLIAERRSISAEDIAELVRSHRHFLVWGVPLEAVIGAWATAMPRLWQELTALAGEQELPELLAAGERAFAFPGAVPALATMWAVEEDPSLVQEEHAARKLLEAVLSGEAAPAWSVPFAVVADPDDPLAHARLARELRSNGSLACTRATHIEGLAADPTQLVVRDGAMVVVGRAVAHAELAEELDVVREAVDAAMRLGRAPGQTADAMLADLLLADSPAVAAVLLDHIISPLREVDCATELIAWVDHGLHRQAAADALGISVSTLRNRLLRVSEVSALDLESPIDVVTAVLATRAIAHEARQPAGGADAKRPPGLLSYPAHLVRGLVEQIDLDELAAEITDAYRAELPSFAPLLPSTGPYEGIRDGLDEAVALICDERLPDEFDFSSRDERVIREFEHGVTIDEMIRSVGVGGGLLWRALCRVATPDQSRSLAMVAGRIFRYFGGLSENRDVEGGAATRLSTASPDLFALLLDGSVSPVRLEHEVRAAGLVIERRWSAAVIVPAPDAPPHVLLATLHGCGIPAVLQGGRVMALVAEDQLWRIPVEPALSVVTHSCGDWIELGGLLRGADAAATAAAREQRTGVLEATEYPLDLLVAASPALAERLRRSVITPLTTPARNADLLGTLEALVDAHLDRSRAADALHLHPNTVAYRLRKITDLTGLDPSERDGLVLLVLGLAAHRVLPAPAATVNGGHKEDAAMFVSNCDHE